MKRSLLVLAAVTIVGGGCRTLMQSAFLSGFRLDRTVKATAYKGIDSTRAADVGGSIGGSAGGIGPRGANVHSSSTSTAGFMIYEEGEKKFNESEFIEALASQIKKEIEESHANITGSASPASNEFYVDYTEGKIKGRITISGSTSGRSYLLKANVDEGSKQ